MIYENSSSLTKSIQPISKRLFFIGVGDANWTLPLMSASDGVGLKITNKSSNSLTISGETDKIWDGSETSSFYIAPGVTKTFFNNSIYYVVS